MDAMSHMGVARDLRAALLRHDEEVLWSPPMLSEWGVFGDSLCTYQQLEHIRPAAAAGAIAVAYFAFRWLIRTRSLERITRPPSRRYSTTQSPAQCEQLIILCGWM